VAIALQAPPTSRYGDPVVASHAGGPDDAEEVEYASQSQTLTRSGLSASQTTIYPPSYCRAVSKYR